MPLRCLDPKDNSSVHAFDLKPEAWRVLHDENHSQRHLRMPCCSSQVILKRSRRGTQYFAHKTADQCRTAPETEMHLRLKRLAMEVARANGWDADTEVAGTTPSGEPWRADMLARFGEHKVAVEIQWSPQTNDETWRRQERYAQSGIRCLWLMRQSGLPVDRGLPAAVIGGDPEQGYVAMVPTGIGMQRVAMEEFLDAAFSKRLRFGVPLGVSAYIRVWIGNMFCWACGAETKIITSVDVIFGPHECRFSVPDLGDHPDLFGLVSGNLPKDVAIGAINYRFSKTQARRYLSNGCAHCDALIGEFHEHEAWAVQIIASSFPIKITESWQRAILARDGSEPGWGVYPPE